MADFRIRLPEGLKTPGTEQDLDWDTQSGRWTLSEREYTEPLWSMGMEPSIEQLKGLLDFFRIKSKIEFQSLVFLSPKDLAAAHQQPNSDLTIQAIHCQKCGNHSTIYRLEGASWHAYGRTCDFGWRKGEIVSSDEIRLLHTPPKRTSRKAS